MMLTKIRITITTAVAMTTVVATTPIMEKFDEFVIFRFKDIDYPILSIIL